MIVKELSEERGYALTVCKQSKEEGGQCNDCV